MQVATRKIPCQATSSAPEGDRQILEYTASGAAPTSPPQRVLRSKRQGAYASSRDALRADSDYRADRLSHRRDGTAGTLELIYRCYRFRAAPLSVTTTGRPGRSSWRMDLAAAAAGIRSTRKSLLWAGWSSQWTWAGATPRQLEAD